MFNKVKNVIRNWLKIEEAQGLNVQINELLDLDGNAFVNRIWYRGEGYEIEQLYKNIPDYKYSFWGARCTKGLEIRKIHTGLPKIIVNSIVNMTADDLASITVEEASKNDTLQQMLEENKIKALVKQAIKDILVTGDGAFKLSIDTDISPFPIIEFYPADAIDVVRERGRIREIVFKRPYKANGKNYILKEYYGYGYINYGLFDEYEKEVDFSRIEELKDLQIITFDKSFIMAEYVNFYDSDKWSGRGQSVYDSKRDNFDALDEAWSQWVDALRANRTKTYIPEDLLPRDANTGAILRGNAFDNRFIKTGTAMQENAKSEITTINGNIAHDSYLATYVTALDLCLQGLISPSTLGIDNKKLDNAEAQREKEKTTLYTRQTIVNVMEKALNGLVDKLFKCYNTMLTAPLEDVQASVTFGEYANPSFESQIETVGKAKTQGVMSIESVIEELYGDSKSEEWKSEEVKRIKEENGIVSLDEPALNTPLEV